MLATRRVLVVHVFELGAGFEFSPPSVPPAPVDLQAALGADQMLAEAARKIAEQGAKGPGNSACTAKRWPPPTWPR